jgi:hypothetical protein
MDLRNLLITSRFKKCPWRFTRLLTNSATVQGSNIPTSFTKSMAFASAFKITSTVQLPKMLVQNKVFPCLFYYTFHLTLSLSVAQTTVRNPEDRSKGKKAVVPRPPTSSVSASLYCYRVVKFYFLFIRRNALVLKLKTPEVKTSSPTMKSSVSSRGLSIIWRTRRTHSLRNLPKPSTRYFHPFSFWLRIFLTKKDLQESAVTQEDPMDIDLGRFLLSFLYSSTKLPT